MRGKNKCDKCCRGPQGIPGQRGPTGVAGLNGTSVQPGYKDQLDR